ncbi:MAG: FAD-binding domain [Caulobacter sp.]|nr:FAD-binding domain [Caulobacter sp.]
MRIAVSGAGVAGPTVAWWLAKAGHDITLIEVAPAFRAGGYVIDFWGVGYSVAERMGLLPKIHQAGYRFNALRLVDEQGRKVGGFSTEPLRRLTGGRLTSLPRGDLARIIFDDLAGRVDTRFDESITAVEDDGDRLRLRFKHSGPEDFDLLIGADGLHSNVRRLVFGAEDRFEKQLGFRVAAFETTGYRPREALTYVAHSPPGQQIARFALDGDRTVFMLVFRADLMDGPEPRSSDEVRAVLHRVYRDVGWETGAILSAMDAAPELYFDRVSQIRMDRWSKGRVALLGDAASAVSLLAGEGTGLAMTEAYVLAGELARAGGDHRAAFAAHEARLRPFITGKQKAAEGMAASFVPRTALGVWFRNLVTRVMAVPGLAELFLGGSVKDDFDLPDYDIRGS